MEKRGVVQPGVTKDTEERIVPGEKKADAVSQTQRLDDDVTKRLADEAAERIDVDESGS